MTWRDHIAKALDALGDADSEVTTAFEACPDADVGDILASVGEMIDDAEGALGRLLEPNNTEAPDASG